MSNGASIYAVYVVAGSTKTQLCTAVLTASGDAYGKWLDTTTNPHTLITIDHLLTVYFGRMTLARRTESLCVASSPMTFGRWAAIEAAASKFAKALLTPLCCRKWRL